MMVDDVDGTAAHEAGARRLGLAAMILAATAAFGAVVALTADGRDWRWVAAVTAAATALVVAVAAAAVAVRASAAPTVRDRSLWAAIVAGTTALVLLLAPSTGASGTGGGPDPVHFPPGPATTVQGGPLVVEGRPLRRRRRLLTPGTGDGEATVDHGGPTAAPAVQALSPLERRVLAERWLLAAHHEHASVPAFADLALVLTGLGAPAHLVAAAHRAALQEVDHARGAFALAGAYAGRPVSAAAMPGLLGRRTGGRRGGRARHLRALAVATLRDGCLNEGWAAAVAREAAQRATDPVVREHLVRVADDEAAHAELAWTVLGWCLGVGDARLHRRVARELDRLPLRHAVPPVDAGVRHDVLVAHGRLVEAGGAPDADAVRAAVVARATALLAAVS